jgi:Ca2+-transporting ATPase
MIRTKVIDGGSFQLQENFLQTGLTEQQALERLNRYGTNQIKERKKKRPIFLFFNQFADFMTLILLAAAVASIFLGEEIEAFVIIAIVIFNGILGFVQEYKTEKTMDSLKAMAAPMSKVKRDGAVKTIETKFLVPGDLLVVESGDRIGADGELVECTDFKVDESLLTGESVPVFKTADSKGDNRIFMGTVAVSGHGMAIVTETGSRTEMGKIAGMISESDDESTPLQNRLARLGKWLVLGCLGICAVVALIGVLNGGDWLDMLLSGISLAVAAIPEGLPVVVTVALAIGVNKMVKVNALARKLSAVETLGNTRVICSDKTGTITENKMTVKQTIPDITKMKPELAAKGLKEEYTQEDILFLTFALCHNVHINNSNNRLEYSGDPTEIALLEYIEKIYPDLLNILNRYKRVGEISFDSNRKCMSVIVETKDQHKIMLTKGNPDVIMSMSDRIMDGKTVRPLTEKDKQKMQRHNKDLAYQGMRVLGICWKTVSKMTEATESKMIFAGLEAMEDLPRAGVDKSVELCKRAGITAIMITGDQPGTAAAVARRVGILPENGKVVTGSQLRGLSQEELDKITDNTYVYAAVSPADKLEIVRSFKRKGYVTAMTGDGVNDAPALKEADIGVAMGINGTDVTREAADLVLLDDNFNTIVTAVREGRIIYRNIRRFIRYLLSCNIGEVLTMFVAAIAGFSMPLVPIQILWVNLVTDGFPAVALGFEPGEKDVMDCPPVPKDSDIFSDGLGRKIIFRGITIGLGTLFIYWLVQYIGGDLITARTAAFAHLVTAQLVHVLECKSEREGITEINLFSNKILLLAITVSFLMLLTVIYIPPLAYVFSTAPLHWTYWCIVMGISILQPFIVINVRNTRRKRLKLKKAKAVQQV